MSAPSKSTAAFRLLLKPQRHLLRTHTCDYLSSSNRSPRYAPKPFICYYIHVNRAFSVGYALFFATARQLLPCFHDLAHSFRRNGGWGHQRTSTTRQARGHAGACPATISFDYAPAPFEKLPTASASVLYTSNTVRSLVICRTS